jgi:hypothetical protein
MQMPDFFHARSGYFTQYLFGITPINSKFDGIGMPQLNAIFFLIDRHFLKSCLSGK